MAQLSDGSQELLRNSYSGNHWNIQWVELLDQTDHHDELARVGESTLSEEGDLHLRGHFFHLTNLETNQSILIVKQSPSAHSQANPSPFDFRTNLSNGELTVALYGTGYSDTDEDQSLPYQYWITEGEGDLWAKWRNHYDDELQESWLGWSPDRTGLMMSNTWGDRNRDERISEDFIKQEIEIAAKIGLDMVQIDDGWQSGITSNSGIAPSDGVWEGFHSKRSDFWEPNLEKFPSGLLALNKLAKSFDVELSLWFAPDSSDGFKNWKKDVDVLCDIRDRYGINTFKLDGINIRAKKDEEVVLAFLDALANAGIHYTLDVTAQKRFGYLTHKNRGLLFVENRYTDWANYYPWKTLRNLWDLSHFVPARRMQFELLNNERNVEQYKSASDTNGSDMQLVNGQYIKVAQRSNIDLAPVNVPIDWSFWSVMPSNPLIWMELSGLSDENIDLLNDAVGVYREIREDLLECYVEPIGERPDGYSWSGFAWRHQKTDEIKYVLVLKQLNDKVSGVLSMNATQIDGVSFARPRKSSPGQILECVVSSDGGTSRATFDSDHVNVEFGDKPWQYGLFKIRR